MTRNISFVLSSLDTFNISNNSFVSLTSISSSFILFVSSSSFTSYLIYYVAVALTGVIGNITTIIVFIQRRLRSLRSSFFLTCLVATDLVSISILVTALLDELHAPVMTIPVCMLTIYLSHIASFLSSNFTLAYTTHRLIAVFFPIKATTFLKQRTNRILALILLTFACLFYSLAFSVTATAFRTNTTNVVNCEEDRAKPFIFPFLVLDRLFTFIIPFSSVSLMNSAIVYKLQTKLTLNNKLSTSSSGTLIITPSIKSPGPSSTETIQAAQLNNGNAMINNNNNITSSESHRLLHNQNRILLCVRPMQRYKRTTSRSVPCLSTQRQTSMYHKNASFHIRSTQCRVTASAKTTKMVLAASTVFLVFNLPYHFLLLCFLFTKQQQPSWMLDVLNIARLWCFVSFCVKFFVYAIYGQRFRNEVVRLFSCSFVRRYVEAQEQKELHKRQNSIYLSHRLLPISSAHISHDN
ncbi:unnamed protein product [Rotaria magnacalcarata]|uniref:G-protein coupled receptors family 1 profile domain-containing protein n=1 Tax=Rotaria magnacalcarata TaxID=392030 RepID=A0A815AB58_9BILA|nr:unnamed protein product [Rotaria magnacalcarata]CAF1508977.1 unnamed protein product [Rotaria magnacalcarata]CAF3811642.1 unnamed protein product [Rotaria magnacalcarata]CAF3814948.1 unnamed protein product [Rotaria magnacalcarata]